MPLMLNGVKGKKTSRCFLFQTTEIQRKVQQIRKKSVDGRERLEVCVTGHPAFWKPAKDQQWDMLTEANMFGFWAVTTLAGNAWSRLR